MCPWTSGQAGAVQGFVCFGIKVFLMIWVLAVPIIVTSRLDKIIKLLEEQNKR